MKVYAIFASTIHINWIILETGMCEKIIKYAYFSGKRIKMSIVQIRG